MTIMIMSLFWREEYEEDLKEIQTDNSSRGVQSKLINKIIFGVLINSCTRVDK
jgi:hypothetical protein